MKMKFGAIVVDARNKIGGHVASKNRAGNYLRTKTTPVNPQTTFQISVRAFFATISAAWRGLTANQRAAWNAAVQDFKRTDIFGDLRNPSGANLHQRLNQNLALIGEPFITSPPMPDVVPDSGIVTLSAAAGAGTMTVAFTGTPVPAATQYVIEATPMMSPGRSYAKNQFRRLTTVAAAGTSPANIHTLYTARFGALVAGQKIFVRVKAVSETTGLTSQYQQGEVIVAA